MQALKYEKFGKESLIFNYGDTGDKFYIILKGKVSVLIPGFFKDKSKPKLPTAQTY